MHITIDYYAFWTIQITDCTFAHCNICKYLYITLEQGRNLLRAWADLLKGLGAEAPQQNYQFCKANWKYCIINKANDCVLRKICGILNKFENFIHFKNLKVFEKIFINIWIYKNLNFSYYRLSLLAEGWGCSPSFANFPGFGRGDVFSVPFWRCPSLIIKWYNTLYIVKNSLLNNYFLSYKYILKYLLKSNKTEYW